MCGIVKDLRASLSASVILAKARIQSLQKRRHPPSSNFFIRIRAGRMHNATYCVVMNIAFVLVV